MLRFTLLLALLLFVPCFGDAKRYRDQKDWQGLLLFHECFHAETGEGLGASHQTGWTSLIVRIER